VEICLNEINKNDKTTYCLGELVHNKDVINNVKEKGVIFISNIDEIKEESARLVIRAHGVDKEIINQAKERDLDVIDLTCPLVKKIHDIAEEYCKKDFFIILIGNNEHPEIVGTKSHCGKNYFVIEDEDKVLEALYYFQTSGIKNLLVISQTTFSLNKFDKIVKDIEEELDSSINIIVKNTICNATEERQKETEELARQVDYMIIVGGKNSSNTKKLFEISEAYTNAILVENSKELDSNLFINTEKIGIMAGASTPFEIIEEVRKKISEKE
jgi:4-hydroxy-3-methylbut-2-enyl diphosphate reductase